MLGLIVSRITLSSTEFTSDIGRYTYQQVSVEMHVVDVIKDQLNRRQMMDGGSRNLVRVMTATCGYGEIRLMAAQRLEMWLQNPKVFSIETISLDSWIKIEAIVNCLLFTVFHVTVINKTTTF